MGNLFKFSYFKIVSNALGAKLIYLFHQKFSSEIFFKLSHYRNLSAPFSKNNFFINF